MESLISVFTFNNEANQLIFNGEFPANEIGYEYTTTFVLTAYLDVNDISE